MVTSGRESGLSRYTSGPRWMEHDYVAPGERVEMQLAPKNEGDAAEHVVVELAPNGTVTITSPKTRDVFPAASGVDISGTARVKLSTPDGEGLVVAAGKMRLFRPTRR